MTHDQHRTEDEITAYVASRGQVRPPADLMERIINDVRRTPRPRSRLTLSRGGRAFAAAGSFVILAVAAVLLVSILRTQSHEIGSSASPSSLAVTAASSATAASKSPTATASPAAPVATTGQVTTRAPGGTGVMTDPAQTATPEPTEPVAEGQPLRASSWTLVADEPGHGEPGTIEAATNAADFERIWADHVANRPVPRLGSDEFVIFFEKSPPFECDNLELTGVALNPANRVLYGMWSDLVGCTSEIAGAHLFVVTVKRDAVPTGVLRLRLSRETEFPCSVACGFQEEIEITL